ncbi:PTS system fructose-specific EIIABC component [Clostridium vincentii]|uniref:PTS system fructose-specific EIIABC component n=1 Tax=Clostridium vincentii TaxID=52704 RepID=A0A2T0BJT6_9CLOT|nr:PTS system fructose-specific EIIABC component [Clostridium vincentii]
MKITDLLKISGIDLNTKVSTKDEAITKLVDLMDSLGNLNDKEAYKKAVLERESLSTTGIGDQIAIPHAKTKAVKAAGLSAMVIRDGIDFDSLDGESVKLFFMIAAPDGENNLHLEVLARLATMLMDANFKNQLINAKSKEEFLALIDKNENIKVNKENDKMKAGSYRILAVTACPTGIAHTYMAAESLENKANEMGVSIKVETNGAGGAKNVLTKQEIKDAECIIIAADKNVSMERFNGKKVIQTKVSNGIHKSEELINKAISGNVPVYNHGSKSSDSDDSLDEKEGIGRQIYKHLMNGVSHMLPFVIGGGILIAIAFLLDDYSIDPSKFGSNLPIAAFFKTIGGTAFDFMLPILAGYIAMSIADRPGLALGFVGGALAKAGTTYASAFDSSISVVSGGFLGALFAGFLAGYIVLGLKKVFSGLPKAFEGIKPILLYPVFELLLVCLVMVFINPFFGSITTAITAGLNSMGGTSRILLGIVVAGMMAIDMGGPFNKAAYLFGTASLASGNYGSSNGWWYGTTTCNSNLYNIL